MKASAVSANKQPSQCMIMAIEQSLPLQVITTSVYQAEAFGPHTTMVFEGPVFLARSRQRELIGMSHSINKLTPNDRSLLSSSSRNSDPNQSRGHRTKSGITSRTVVI